MPILLRSLFVLLLAVASGSCLAEDPAPASSTATPAQTLALLNSQLVGLRTQADAKDLDAALLNDLRSKALALQQQAEQLTSVLTPQKDSVDTRIGVLGPAPAKGVSEPAPLSQQRRQLEKSQNELTGQIAQAKSIEAETGLLAAHVAELRRDQFQAQLATRTATPFSAAFWADPAKTFPDDIAHLREWRGEVAAAVQSAWQPPNRTPFVLCMLVAALLLSVGRWLIERSVVRLTTNRMPAGKLRRSALATAVALASTLSIGLAAHFVYLAINWNDILSEDLDALARRLVRLVFFAAFMTGLGRAILSNKHPSWRLATLSDDAAQRLRLFPWLLGAATLLLGTVESINNAVGVSLLATVATRGFLAVLIACLVGDALLRLGRARRAAQASGERPTHRPLWAGLTVAAAFGCVVLTLLGVASGYIAFAFFIARQMLWVGVIFTALYLLMHLADDICDTVFARKGRTGQRLQSSFGLAPDKLEQTGTVLSGISRAMLVIFAAMFVLAPYGAGPQELVARIGDMLSKGSVLGNLSIVPSHIFDALLVFVLGMIVLRVIKQWLSDQLLPKTSLDLGMQASMLTLLGYTGGVLVFVLALLALQVNLQSIAWMASALSVGIGFGLQAIVSNFISGLILLAERPVKVGDWVSIGGVEGDIRRINVRATEIQMNDRSTMIVPNSQFITQNVRNVTLANAQARVQIKLPMPVDTDAAKARAIILDVMRGHASTLDMPAPFVRLDSVDAASMTFSATAFVHNPREASDVKSDLLFEILQRLRDAQLPLSKPQDMVVRTLGPLVSDSGDDPKS